MTPPGLLILLLLLGLLVHIKKPWLGATLIGVTTAVFIALSLPLTAHELMRGLEVYPALNALTLRGREAPQAIVVLGGDRYANAEEYGGEDTVGTVTLERLRYGAYLQRKTGLPILVSGGAPFGERSPLAQLMRVALARDFQIPARWVEDRSADTIENARFSYEILQAAGVTRIYLVTHAWHLRRAVPLFERAGFKVTPAPTAFTNISPPVLLGYFPSAGALRLSSRALHERIGYWWNQRQDGKPPAKSPEPSQQP